MLMLPVIRLGKKLYFKDERLGQLRNVKDPFDVESIELAYSPKAKNFFKGGEPTFAQMRRLAKAVLK